MTKPNNKSLHIQKGTELHESVNPDYRAKKIELKSKAEYVDGVRNGDRILLSQAITLIESTKEEYRARGQQVLEECMPYTGKSVRIGITGVPGVGKSTFIESIGQMLIQKGRKLAVLTIDPSSSRSKGSILGDKTRMPKLSSNKNAYIRPSPTSGTLGGVAQKTRETLLLCEAAGFDAIFIETVGVGQSETVVHSMVDFFLLLMLAGAGDELQGMKRGIMEMADLIAINKADGENIKSTERAKREYENALSLFPKAPSGQETNVFTCSALTGEGVEKILSEIETYVKNVVESNYFAQCREEQSLFWMNEAIQQRLKETFYSHPLVKSELKNLQESVKTGSISPSKAADFLIQAFSKGK